MSAILGLRGSGQVWVFALVACSAPAATGDAGSAGASATGEGGGASSAGGAAGSGSSGGSSTGRSSTGGASSGGRSSGGTTTGGSTGTAPDGGTADAGLHWFPGNYVLLASHGPTAAEAKERSSLLADGGLAGSFEGIEVVYDWMYCEGAEGDYDAGFAGFDGDLDAVAKAGKKLIVMLSYQTFTGSGSAPSPVPEYMLDAGPWCLRTGDAGTVCGGYTENNGLMAMIWQGAQDGGVSDRLLAWIGAFGAHIRQNPHFASLAAIELPETASAATPALLAQLGYTSSIYLAALERDALACAQSFPGVPALTQVNFIPGGFTGAEQTQMLEQFADWALLHPTAGLGCPDVGPLLVGGIPGYGVLINPKYQGRVPSDVGVEYNDFESSVTTSLAATYALAIDPADAGMGAQIIKWGDFNSTAPPFVFSIGEVAQYVTAHPDPNTATPTW